MNFADRSGVTLLELLVASAVLGILSIASLSWLELLAQGARAPELADRMQTTRRKVESVLDKIHCKAALQALPGDTLRTKLISGSHFQEVELSKIVLPMSGESILEVGRPITSHHQVDQMALRPFVTSSEISGGAIPGLDSVNFYGMLNVTFKRLAGLGGPKISWEIPIRVRFLKDGELSECSFDSSASAGAAHGGTTDLAGLAQGFGLDLETHPHVFSGGLTAILAEKDTDEGYSFVRPSQVPSLLASDLKTISVESKKIQTASYLQMSFGAHLRLRMSASASLRLVLQVMDGTGHWRSCSGASGRAAGLQMDFEISAACVTTLPPGEFKVRFNLVSNEEHDVTRMIRAWGTLSLTSLGQEGS